MPAVSAARKLVKQGTKGFDLATGLLAHPLNTFDVVHVRNKLSPHNKLGFDTAVALHTGLVSKPIAKTLGPTAQAANAITLGSQGMKKANRNVLISNVAKSSANATVGVKKAVSDIKKEAGPKSTRINPNTNIIAKFFYALGFR